VEDATTVGAGTAEQHTYTEIIREKIAKKGISVVFVEGECPKDAVFQKIRI
jgi:hypothetical protein